MITFLSILSFIIILILFSDVNRNDLLNFSFFTSSQFKQSYGEILLLLFIGIIFVTIPIANFSFLKLSKQQSLRDIFFQILKFVSFFLIWVIVAMLLHFQTNFWYVYGADSSCGSSFCSNYKNYLMQIIYVGLLILGNWFLSYDWNKKP